MPVPPIFGPSVRGWQIVGNCYQGASLGCNAPAAWYDLGMSRVDPAEQSAQSQTTTSSHVTLRVEELDCAEEARQLQAGLAKSTGIERLDFNPIQGRMFVEYDPAQTSPADLIAKVRGLGMTAHVEIGSSAVDSGPKASDPRPVSQSDRLRRKHTIRSGAFLVVAVAIQAWSTGDWLGILGHTGHSHPVPLAAILLYLLSTALGMRWVVPKAWSAVKRRSADMNVLMCVAVTGALLLGQWFEAAMVTFLFSLSLLLEQWSVGKARRSIAALMESAPETARRRCGHGHFHVVDVHKVGVGDICQVLPGERIPLDGVVTEGQSTVNQAPITGESIPMEKQAQSLVFAGTINGQGLLQFEVRQTSGETMLARIIRLVEQAHANRAPSQQWVERFASYYTPAMMLLAAAVMLVPPLVLGASFAAWFYNGLVLLVIACPCALVIATPVSIVSGLTAAAHRGVLVKGGMALESLAKVDAIVMDKTGTLTEGAPRVDRVIPADGTDETSLIEIAGSLHRGSTHPLALAIAQYAEQKEADRRSVENLHELIGQGVEGRIDGVLYWSGSSRMARRRDSQCEEFLAKFDEAEFHGSLVVVGREARVLGVLILRDGLRDSAAEMIAQLHHLGIRHVEILSGDRPENVRPIAEATGVDHYAGDQLPEDKIRQIETLQASGRSVAMLGDGVNDSPALAAADVGIALGAIGSDAAIEAADVALMSDEIDKVPWLIRHGRRTLFMIQQNIAFALGVKLLFVLLAVAGYSSLWMAIIADTGVSLVVIANSLRLLR